jgi:hypothetical protein
LHEGFNIIEGIVEHPITCSSNTTSNHRNVNGNFALLNSRRCELLGKIFDDWEVKAKTSTLSDGSGTLSAVKTLKTILLEDLFSGIKWSGINFISLSSLDLDSNSCMLNGALYSWCHTTNKDTINPAPKAAIVFSNNSRGAGVPLPFLTESSFLKFSKRPKRADPRIPTPIRGVTVPSLMNTYPCIKREDLQFWWFWWGSQLYHYTLAMLYSVSAVWP